MKQKTLFWHIFPSVLIIQIVTLVAVAFFASHAFRAFYLERIRHELKAIGQITALQLAQDSDTVDSPYIEDVCTEIGQYANARLTVVLPSGTVVADTDHDPASMDNHADRPEIREAWKTGSGTSTRLSGTLQDEMLYIAVVVRINDAQPAVVRVARSSRDISTAIERLTQQIALFGLLTIAIVTVTVALLTRRISRPLDEIRQGAEAYTQGQFIRRLPSSSVTELDVVSSAMNRMADELNEQIATITRQRDEENALLSCMTEAVLAVNTERKLIKINQSAKKLLNIQHAVLGHTPVAEVIRNADLLDIVVSTLTSDDPVEGDIYLADRDRYLQAHGTALHDSEGRHVGAVVAINDVTRLRHLATMRRDFVANVSHELKTPITAIKGFAETLVDEQGDYDPNHRRFLEIINRQANRLQAIVEDLLTLAEIEHNTENHSLEFSTGTAIALIESVVSAHESAATARNIQLKISCPEPLQIQLNQPLLEEALGNLVSNAIKYSPEQSTIRITGAQIGKEVTISVSDEGPGIARNHLPRIFERFYRVDKSRSRKCGGTGLGLSICHRIVLAHGGTMDVDSELGRGSTFTMHLPALS